MGRQFLVLIIAFTLAFTLSMPVVAASFSANDEATLIAAINTANVNGEDDVITLTAGFALTGTLPNISTVITIDGAGNTIDCNATRALWVDTSGDLTLENITISGCSTGGSGAIVANFGTLTVRNSALSNSTASGGGGAIYNFNTGSSATIIDSTISNNQSTGTHGGAIAMDVGSTVSISGSTFSNNRAPEFRGGAIWTDSNSSLTIVDSSFNSNTARTGGAIYAFSTSPLRVTNSQFDSNSATTAIGPLLTIAIGGAIYTQAPATISNSTFTNNTSRGDGGGIYAGSSGMTLTNSTFDGNRATDSNSGNGGAIYLSGSSNISNTTFSNNTAGSFGGGINIQTGNVQITNSTFSTNTGQFGGALGTAGGANLTVTHSTLFNNIATDTFFVNPGEAIRNFGTTNFVNSIILSTNTAENNCTAGAGTITASGLSDDGSCGAMTVETAANINLGALANNGGPTQTHALLAGSVAIDTGGSCGLSSDQRGAARDATCDIGAYEDVTFTLPTVEFAAATNSFYESDGTVTITLTVTGAVNFAGVATVMVSDILSGTATSGSDYSAFADQTVTIDCSSGTCPATIDVTLTLLTDALVEVDETLNLEISNSNGMVIIGAQDSHETTILDGAPPASTDTPEPPVAAGGGSSSPSIAVFDPAISKLGFLQPGQTGVTGEELEWIITVSNVGIVSGSNVTVTDTLNPALQIDSVDAQGATVSIAGQTVTVVYPTLNVGQTVSFSIFTTVLQGAIIENTACVNASNQGVEECATGIAVSELPITGETPPWHYALLACIGILLGSVVLLRRNSKIA